MAHEPSHPTKLMLYPSLHSCAADVEGLDYAAQAVFAEMLAFRYEKRVEEDEAKKRPKLAAQGKKLQAAALALRKELLKAAAIKPKKKPK
ncbi:MAG: hypothetical protein AAB734_02680 [Patescibacteria group bacterium]